jgi:hypothetical protein
MIEDWMVRRLEDRLILKMKPERLQEALHLPSADPE